MRCTITSPTQTRSYENVQGVTLPAFAGQMQILPGHAEIFTLLKKGTITLRQPGKQKETVVISGGACHFKNNRVTIVL